MSFIISELSPETGLLMKQLTEKAKKQKRVLGFAQKAAQLFKRRRQREKRKPFAVHNLKRQAKLRAIGFGRKATIRFKANRKRTRTIRFFKRKRKR